MNKKILIVDDEFPDLESMKTILEKENFEVYIATNGAKALDALKGNKFDLIMIDIKMPTLSGYDLLRLMKEKMDTKTKTIFVTIVPKQEVEMNGIDGFVQKPFSPEKLVKEVKKILG